MQRDEKQKEIEHLNEAFKNNRNLFLAGFQGLTVSQDTELRRAIRSTGSQYQVVKNTLAQKASQETPAEPLKEKFTGSTAIAFNDKDPVALAKALSTFAKTNPLFVFKAGVVEGRVVHLSDLEQIANLPSKEELISKLMFLINSQAQRLATALAAVPRNLAVVLDQAGEQNKFAA
jgi:large subunit ribosomal protein L10